MRLLIDDTLATAPFTYPLSAGWVDLRPTVAVEARPNLPGGDVAPDDLALLPTAEVALLQVSHAVAPDAAVVAGPTGPVSLRTPVRPDEVARGPVRLLDAGGTAELFARATLRPFYGIEPSAWLAGDDPAAAEAQAVVVAGAAALRPPEGGFAEDLCRAWLILTDLPAVTHVLVAPLAAERGDLAPALAALAALREAGQARRREWRPIVAEAAAVPLDRLHPFFAGQRLALAPADRPAVVQLFQRGGRGSAFPPLSDLRFLDPPPAAD